MKEGRELNLKRKAERQVKRHEEEEAKLAEKKRIKDIEEAPAKWREAKAKEKAEHDAKMEALLTKKAPTGTPETRVNEQKPTSALDRPAMIKKLTADNAKLTDQVKELENENAELKKELALAKK